jgi:methyl-accepting chemotaxis protein
MFSLSNVKMKYKLVIMLALPLLGFIYFFAAGLSRGINTQAEYVSVVIVALGFLVTIITAVFMLRNINRSLKAMTEQIEDIAGGDLTSDIEVDGSDEFAYVQKTMKAMKEELRGIISSVNQGAESVRLGTTEISFGHNDLSQRTEEQAASLEEATASMEQMAESVTRNARHAEQARESVLQAKERAQQGALTITNAIGAVTKIDGSSAKMSNIISVINEISFQTNLLALNAAVEAARAGEKGRGFAVVAREIRELAQRSEGSAREISDLIKENIENSRNGMELVEESGEILGEIVGDIVEADKIVSDIAKSCLDQSGDIEQMNAMVMGLNDMTQQNAALVEETTANTRSMAGHVQALSCKVAVFKLSKRTDKRHGHQNEPMPTDSKSYPAASVIPFKDHGNSKDMSVQPRQQKRASNDGWEDF